MDIIKPVEKVFDKKVLPVLSNPLSIIILGYLAIVASTVITEKLPKNLLMLLKSHIVVVAVIFSVFYVSTDDFTKSLLIVGVLIGLSLVVKLLQENFDLINPDTNTLPGCVDVQLQDLLAVFNGDRDKLKQAMYVSGVPLNLQLTDANAPLISTYLVNDGKYKIAKNCHVP
jgi:hypothetical protein